LAVSQKERERELRRWSRELELELELESEIDIWSVKASKEIRIISGINLSLQNIATAFQRISPLPQHRNLVI